MKKLRDIDKMPWGRHAGQMMQDVPASYFHFFWTQKGFKSNMTDPVADYIRRNLVALKQEYKDGIWT